MIQYTFNFLENNNIMKSIILILSTFLILHFAEGGTVAEIQAKLQDTEDIVEQISAPYYPEQFTTAKQNLYRTVAAAQKVLESNTSLPRLGLKNLGKFK